MNLSLSDVMFVGIIIMIVAGLLAGLGELRDFLDEGRQLDRAQRLADLDNERRTPVARTEPFSLGDHVMPIDPDPALGCPFCGPPFDPWADCACASACKDPNCGWLAWLDGGNTEELER